MFAVAMFLLDTDPFFPGRTIIDDIFLLLEIFPGQVVAGEGERTLIGFLQPFIDRRERITQSQSLADHPVNFIIAFGLADRLNGGLLIEQRQDIAALNDDQIFMFVIGLGWQDQVGIGEIVFQPGMHADDKIQIIAA